MSNSPLKKNKLLFITTKSQIGGAQKFVKEQIDICKNDFHIFLCTNQNDWLTQQVEVENVLLNKSIEKAFSIGFLIQLVKFIKKNKIDLVITNSANAGFYGRIAAYIASVNSCYYSHGWSSVYNGGKLSFLLNGVEKFLSKISTKVICVSNNDYNTAIKKIGISADKLLVVKNATLPVFNQKNTVQNQPLKVIALARFANPKRIDLMIKSFEKIDNAELSIAGTGPGFEMWKQYVHDKKITNVTLLGEIPSFSAFNEYDAFVLISNSEGLPISAIEAMSADLPLILSNVGGCSELIKNNGVLVENNIDSIISGVNKVIENYSIYQKNSQEFYNEAFNLQTINKKYINLYTDLINRN